MKTWFKTYWQPLLLGVVAMLNILMWTPLHCLVGGVLIMAAIMELDK